MPQPGASPYGVVSTGRRETRAHAAVVLISRQRAYRFPASERGFSLGRNVCDATNRPTGPGVPVLLDAPFSVDSKMHFVGTDQLKSSRERV
jgi:hypothetical protein